MQSEDWQNSLTRCFGMLMDGRAEATGIVRRAQDATLLLILNSYHDVLNFTLPEATGGSDWAILIDTNVPHGLTDAFRSGTTYDITGRSLLLFQLKPDGPAKMHT